MDDDLKDFPVPADVLDQARHWCAMYAALNATEASMLAQALLAEYDRRGERIAEFEAQVSGRDGGGQTVTEWAVWFDAADPNDPEASVDDADETEVQARA